MAYQHIGDALASDAFIRRIDGCVIDLSAAIMGATQGSGTIQDDALNDLTTLSCKNWCTNYIKGTTAATPQIIAKFLLLNSTVSANPTTCPDGDLNWQLKHVFLQLVSIG
jgi:hypothetical protein